MLWLLPPSPFSPCDLRNARRCLARKLAAKSPLSTGERGNVAELYEPILTLIPAVQIAFTLTATSSVEGRVAGVVIAG